MHDSLQEHLRSPRDPKHQFQGYPVLTDQVTKEGVSVVWHALEATLRAGTQGDVVEFGCYAGTTSVFIRRLLNQHQSSKAFHVYDSFAGLPEKTTQDANAAGVDFTAGKLYVSKADFVKVFRQAGLQLPVIHKGWFNTLTDKDVPPHIAFAFLDGDFYRSIIDSLRLVWPRLSPGGTVLIDDYQRETLPGVEQALRDFFQDKPGISIRKQHNIALVKKP